MRPAHYAREVLTKAMLLEYAKQASMRPAHYAREVHPRVAEPNSVALASMRPAHYAREVGPGSSRSPAQSRGFNEARALCAGSSAGSEAPITAFT